MMLLKHGDKVQNQHGHTGTVVLSQWNQGAPYQVIDQFNRYHTDINEDGASNKNNIVWRSVTTMAIAV